MTYARARRGPLLLVAFVILGLALLNPLSASAAPAPAGAAVLVERSVPNSPVPAVTIGGAHRCDPFGAVVGGYVAAHCADLDEVTNSAGSLAIRGLGQAFCQRAASHTNVRCAGIVQLITITDLTTGQAESSGNKTCGAFGGAACPASASFRNTTAFLYRLCGHIYQTTVRTTTLLPSSVGTSRSGDFFSAAVGYTC